MPADAFKQNRKNGLLIMGHFSYMHGNDGSHYTVAHTNGRFSHYSGYDANGNYQSGTVTHIGGPFSLYSGYDAQGNYHSGTITNMGGPFSSYSSNDSCGHYESGTMTDF
jgi:hypothetical protein